jgi:hypothetical protein
MPAIVRSLNRIGEAPRDERLNRDVPGLDRQILSRDLQQSVPVQRREDPVKIVVVLHEVMVQVSEEMRGDPAGRLRRHDDVEPSVVEGDGDLQRLPETGGEIGVAEGRGEENKPPDAGFVFARKDSRHEAPVARSDEDQISRSGEALFKLRHPLLKRTGVVLHEHPRISRPEVTSLRSSAAAFETVDECARNVLHFVYLQVNGMDGSKTLNIAS